jgi:hypothetical protein
MTEPRQEPEIEIIGDESEPSYAMELPALRTPGFAELFGPAYATSEEWIRLAWAAWRCRYRTSGTGSKRAVAAGGIDP